MAKITLEIKNSEISKLLADVGAFQLRKRGQINEAIKRAILGIESDAKVILTYYMATGNDKRLRPLTGMLRASIRSLINEMSDFVGGEVFSDVFYAPYLEFGTIDKVQIPTGEAADEISMQEFAAQFKGQGIRTSGGIAARPYLFPAYEKWRSWLITEIQNILSQE